LLAVELQQELFGFTRMYPRSDRIFGMLVYPPASYATSQHRAIG
jgi:hypothetical protein